MVTVPQGSSFQELYDLLSARSDMRYQRLLPVIAADGRLVGALSWNDVLERAARKDLDGVVDDEMHRDLVVAYPDETLRRVADRMAERHIGVLPVVERGKTEELHGLITQFDLLRARSRMLAEERHREQVLDIGRLSSKRKA
jgi:CIC family chloride channel protein